MNIERYKKTLEYKTRTCYEGNVEKYKELKKDVSSILECLNDKEIEILELKEDAKKLKARWMNLKKL